MPDLQTLSSLPLAARELKRSSWPSNMDMQQKEQKEQKDLPLSSPRNSASSSSPHKRWSLTFHAGKVESQKTCVPELKVSHPAEKSSPIPSNALTQPLD